MTFTVESKMKIEIRDGNGQLISASELRFANALLEVLEDSWLKTHADLSDFSMATRHQIVVDALEARICIPRGAERLPARTCGCGERGKHRAECGDI